MKGDSIKKYSLARNVLTFLDILLAVLIIICAWKLYSTPLGPAALTFGLVMLTITTVLKVLQKW